MDALAVCVGVSDFDGVRVAVKLLEGVRVSVALFVCVRVAVSDCVADWLGVGLGLGTKAQQAGLGIVQAKSSKSPAAEIATQSWPR